MKNRFASLLALFSFIFSSIAIAQVNYPIVTPQVKVDIANIYKEKGEVALASEYREYWDGDFVVINNENRDSAVFQVSFEDTTFRGYKAPVLTRHGFSDAAHRFAPLDNIGFKTENGIKYYYGFNDFVITRVYYWAWTFKDDKGIEQWAATFTWGNGAAYDEPGDTIDRAEYGTLPGEEKEIGIHYVGDVELKGNALEVVIFYDTSAKFHLEGSTDLKTWKKVEVEDVIIPETGVDIFQAATFTAPAPAGSTRFFIRFRTE